MKVSGERNFHHFDINNYLQRAETVAIYVLLLSNGDFRGSSG